MHFLHIPSDILVQKPVEALFAHRQERGGGRLLQSQPFVADRKPVEALFTHRQERGGGRIGVRHSRRNLSKRVNAPTGAWWRKVYSRVARLPIPRSPRTPIPKAMRMPTHQAT